MEKLQPNLFFPFAGVAAVCFLCFLFKPAKACGTETFEYRLHYDRRPHKAQMMSCYITLHGNTNLDSIAADGVRFTQSFVANSLNGPQVVPA